MKYSVKVDDRSDWGSFGPWFESFVDLASRLHRAHSMGHKYSKILIGVPKSDYIALALSIGFSRSAFLQGANFADSISPEQIKPGDTIEIRSGWDRNPVSGDDRLPKCTVGEIRTIEKTGEFMWNLSFDFANNLPREERKYRSFEANGTKHPTDLIRLFKVPKGTPERPENGKKVREIAGRRSKITRLAWEGWDYQVNPTLVIFGATGRLDDYKKPLMRDEELHSKLEIESDTLFNVARLDNLTDDVNPHFVNAVEQIVKFPKKTSHTIDTLSRFPFACLDGNQAILLLSEEFALANKTLIGLWEMAGNHHQNESVRTFTKAASESREVSDFANAIGWNPPAGVQIWGWK